MKQRPLLFDLLGACFILMAMALPMQIAWTYGYSLMDLPYILPKLTLSNWLLITLYLTNAALSFMVNQFLVMTLPTSLIATVINNWLVAKYGQQYSMSQVLLGTFFVVSVIAAYYHPKIYQCLTNPNFRWWRSHPRIKASYPLEVKVLRDNLNYCTMSYDISQGGMFIQDAPFHLGQRPKIGDQVQITIKTEHGEVECNAVVVRTGQGKGEYPSGVGVAFTQKSKRFHNYFWPETLESSSLQ